VGIVPKGQPKTVAEGRKTRAKPAAERKPVPYPAWEPNTQDRSTVMMGMTLGMTEERIAALLTLPPANGGKGSPGITVETLHRYFPEEIATGKDKLEMQLAGTMWSKAMGNSNGAVTAGIFLAKSKFGWRDNVVIDLGADDDGTTSITLRMGEPNKVVE
jgi:hypothetical protein